MKSSSATIRRLILCGILVFSAGFLTATVLGMLQVLTFDISASLAMLALAAVALLGSLSQRSSNRSLAKKECVLAGALLLCAIALLVLRLCGVIK